MTDADLAHLRLLHDQAQRELAKADAKSATLLAFALAVLFAVTQTLLDSGWLPVVELTLTWVSALSTLAAVLALLAALRPRLRGAVPVAGSWLHATRSSPDQVLIASRGPERALAEDVCALARLAAGKYARVNQAVILLGVGVVSVVAGLYLAPFVTVVSG